MVVFRSHGRILLVLNRGLFADGVVKLRLDEKVAGLDPVDIVDDVVRLSRDKFLWHVDNFIQREGTGDSEYAVWPDMSSSAGVVIVTAVPETGLGSAAHIHAVSVCSAM